MFALSYLILFELIAMSLMYGNVRFVKKGDGFFASITFVWLCLLASSNL